MKAIFLSYTRVKKMILHDLIYILSISKRNVDIKQCFDIVLGATNSVEDHKNQLKVVQVCNYETDISASTTQNF